MKTIVIAGGGRHVGKTTLAFALADLLQSAQVVKLGDHPKREDKSAIIMPLDTPYAELLRRFPKCSYLVLESGSILDDADLVPDFVIYLPTGEGRIDKPGSERRKKRADLVRGETSAEESRSLLADKLGIDIETAGKIHGAIEASN